MFKIINKYRYFVHNFKHYCLCGGFFSLKVKVVSTYSSVRTQKACSGILLAVVRHTANMYIPQLRLKFALTSPEKAIAFFLRSTNCLEYLWPLQ